MEETRKSRGQALIVQEEIQSALNTFLTENKESVQSVVLEEGDEDEDDSFDIWEYVEFLGAATNPKSLVSDRSDLQGHSVFLGLPGEPICFLRNVAISHRHPE